MARVKHDDYEEWHSHASSVAKKWEKKGHSVGTAGSRDSEVFNHDHESHEMGPKDYAKWNHRLNRGHVNESTEHMKISESSRHLLKAALKDPKTMNRYFKSIKGSKTRSTEGAHTRASEVSLLKLKKLRGESVEVNEISNKKAGDYYVKAARSKADAYYSATHREDEPDDGVDRRRHRMGWEVSHGERAKIDDIQRRRGKGMSLAKKKIERNGKNKGWTDRVDAQHEETEVNEVSKKLLGRYVSKAAEKIRANHYKADAGFPLSAKNLKSDEKRSKGLEMADDKLGGYARVNAREAVEVNEISKKLMVNYMTKSKAVTDPLHKKMRKEYDKGLPENPADEKLMTKRIKGQNIAKNKFYGQAKVGPTGTDRAYSMAQAHLRAAKPKHFKEETEVNEVSKKLLGRYVKNAAMDGTGAGLAFGQSSGETRDKMLKRSMKRMMGMRRAGEKLSGSARVNVPEAIEVKDTEVIKGAKKEGKARKRFLSLFGAKDNVDDKNKVTEANNIRQLRSKANDHFLQSWRHGTAADEKREKNYRQGYSEPGSGAAIKKHERRDKQHSKARDIAFALLRKKKAEEAK